MVLEINAFHQLHDEVVAAFVAEEVVDLDNVRAGERGGGARLTAEALNVPRVGAVEFLQRLDGDRPAQAMIPAAEDGRHAAARQVRAELVASADHHAFESGPHSLFASCSLSRINITHQMPPYAAAPSWQPHIDAILPSDHAQCVPEAGVDRVSFGRG